MSLSKLLVKTKFVNAKIKEEKIKYRLGLCNVWKSGSVNYGLVFIQNLLRFGKWEIR